MLQPTRDPTLPILLGSVTQSITPMIILSQIRIFLCNTPVELL